MSLIFAIIALAVYITDGPTGWAFFWMTLAWIFHPYKR